MGTHSDLSVTIAGAGNVGSFLAIELFKAGCTITQVYSRTEAHAAGLAAKVNSTAITDPAGLNFNTDLIILALPDKVVVDFCKRLAGVPPFRADGPGGVWAENLPPHGSDVPADDTAGVWAENLPPHGSDDTADVRAENLPPLRRAPVVASTAGSVDLAEFTALYPDCGVIYPLQTFTKATHPEPSVIPFCIEGSNFRVEQLLEDTAKRISNDVRFITSGQRLIIHLAAVFACNFTNHMIALADRILEKANLDLSILMPLINETFSRLQANKPFDVQTGPAVRNDLNTIGKHTELLGQIDEFALKSVYTLLSENIELMHHKKD